MIQQCWFCNAEENLRPHERNSDSAPYVNDDGSPQMICEECYQDSNRHYRGALSLMSDAAYAQWAEHESRKEDEAERDR